MNEFNRDQASAIYVKIVWLSGREMFQRECFDVIAKRPFQSIQNVSLSLFTSFFCPFCMQSYLKGHINRVYANLPCMTPL